MFVEHKEVGEVTEAPAKITKMSQAIREGCKHHPKAIGSSFDGVGTCAIGAAYVGVFGRTETNYATCWLKLDKAGVWPDGDFLPGLIHGKNDWQGWSRERIADWLEAQGH